MVRWDTFKGSKDMKGFVCSGDTKQVYCRCEAKYMLYSQLVMHCGCWFRSSRMSQNLNKKTSKKERYWPELSLPFSGLPLEYIVANFPSRMNRNHPLDPFESSKAAESDHTYKQSRPRQILQSRQWYAFPGRISLASSTVLVVAVPEEELPVVETTEASCAPVADGLSSSWDLITSLLSPSPPLKPFSPIRACTLENTPSRAKWSRKSSCVLDMSSSIMVSTTRWPSSSSWGRKGDTCIRTWVWFKRQLSQSKGYRKIVRKRFTPCICEWC